MQLVSRLLGLAAALLAMTSPSVVSAGPLTCSGQCFPDSVLSTKCVCEYRTNSGGGTVHVDVGVRFLVKSWGYGGAGGCQSGTVSTAGGGGGYTWFDGTTLAGQTLTVASLGGPATFSHGGNALHVFAETPYTEFAIPGGGGGGGCATGSNAFAGAGGAGGGPVGQHGHPLTGAATGGDGGTQVLSGAPGTPNGPSATTCPQLVDTGIAACSTAYGGGGGAGQCAGGGGGCVTSFGAGGGGGASWVRAPSGTPAASILVNLSGTSAGIDGIPGNSGDPDRGQAGVGGPPGQDGGLGRVVVIALDYPGRLPAKKGDIDGDGKTDLVLRNNPSWEHRFWLMNGASRLNDSPLSPQTADTSWELSGVDDFDADGRQDLVLWRPTTGEVEFWLMNGTTRIGQAVPFAPGYASPWKLSATADFNHDGRPDLVWRNFSTQKVEIWTMNGTTCQTMSQGTCASKFAPNPDQAADANWEIVGAVDLNNDGNTDLLWYNWSSGKIVYWWMDASLHRTAGNFTSPASSGDSNWKVLAVGDYGVGAGGVFYSNDIVWRNANSGRFVVWYMNFAGTRTWGEFTTPDAPSPNSTDWTIAGPR